MPGPSPAIAATRVAVRPWLRALSPGELVLVACSGGPDSLALTAAAVFEARAQAVRVGAVVVDHGLQPGSARIAERAARQCRDLGADPVERRAAEVGTTGEGPEGAARTARYAELTAVADRLGAAVVLLGHTLDDQAEQVLLGLARGSGARSLAGMPSRRGIFARPLLGVQRSVVHQAAADQGLRAWHDPSNADPAFARSRVRTIVLPLLEEQLGPGVALALARTAELLREDAETLDALAERTLAELIAGSTQPSGLQPPELSQARHVGKAPDLAKGPDADRAPDLGKAYDADKAPDLAKVLGPALDAGSLAAHPHGLRRRVLHRWLLALGCPGAALSRAHVLAVDALLTDWHGQGRLDLPGGVGVLRRSGRLVPVRPTTVEERISGS